jgi:hypothetical protein
VTIHAVATPRIALGTPTPTINISELSKYRGKVVSTKCPQILSAGKSACRTTIAIGNSTASAIIQLVKAHGNQVRSLDILTTEPNLCH